MTRLWSSCLVVALLVLGTVVVGGRGAAQEREFINPATALPAANGTHYVCSSILSPPSETPNRGNHGYLLVRFYNAPNCSGEFIGSAMMFSEGATSAFSDSDYLYGASGLIASAQMLQRAAVFGEKVQWFRCTQTKDNCLRYISLRGDF